MLKYFSFVHQAQTGERRRGDGARSAEAERRTPDSVASTRTRIKREYPFHAPLAARSKFQHSAPIRVFRHSHDKFAHSA